MWNINNMGIYDWREIYARKTNKGNLKLNASYVRREDPGYYYSWAYT